MKRLFIAQTLLATLICPTVSTAATPIDGWYTGAFGGYAYVPSNHTIQSWGVTRSDVNYQSGYDVGGSLGFKSNPMRYEGELSYLKANLNSFRVNQLPQTNPTGYNNAVLGLANVYYDFLGLTTPLQPFLGAGIGYGWVQTKLNSSGPFSPSNFNVANSVFAYQATGGLTYNFAENYALSLGYRYVATTQIADLGQMFQVHLANVGATYRFDGKKYA
jgi:opacity protein-like surface antigen